jgi:hypothetical protein
MVEGRIFGETNPPRRDRRTRRKASRKIVATTHFSLFWSRFYVLQNL